jgi:hypothetical protein
MGMEMTLPARSAFCALVAVLLNPPPVIADVTGTNMLEWCSDATREPLSAGGAWCLGYLTGMRHGINLDRALVDRASKTGPCIPDGVDAAQMARVTVKFLNEHPAQLHQPPSWLAYMSLELAFPCQK